MSQWDITFEAAWAAAMQCKRSRDFLFDSSVLPLPDALAMSGQAPVLSGFKFLPARFQVKRSPALEIGHLLCNVYQDASLLLCAVYCLSNKYNLIPTLYHFTRDPSFADASIASHRVALFLHPNHPNVFLRFDFTWLNSGVLGICLIIHPIAQAQANQGAFPAVAKIETRVYPAAAATALRQGYQFPDSTFLNGTTLLLQPTTGYIALDVYDTRHQSACLFCMSRKLAHCDCPVLFRRRYQPMAQPTAPATHTRNGALVRISWNQVDSSIQKNFNSGIMTSKWRFILPRGTAPAIDTLLASKLSSYRFFYTAGTYMLKLVQRLFGESGLALGTAQNNLGANRGYRLLTGPTGPEGPVTIAHEVSAGLLTGRSQMTYPEAGPSRLPHISSIHNVPPAPIYPGNSPTVPVIIAHEASRNVRVGRGPPSHPAAGPSNIPPIRSIRKVPRASRQPENRVLGNSQAHECLNLVHTLNYQDGTWRAASSSGQPQAPLRTNMVSRSAEIERQVCSAEIEPQVHSAEIEPQVHSAEIEPQVNSADIEPASEASSPAVSRSGTPVRTLSPEEERERGIAIGPGLWRCLECGMEIRGRRANLNRHIENRHDLIRKFECPNADCGKKFQSKVNLDRHIAGVHEGRPLKCPKCPRDFKTPEGLSEHNRIAHEKPRTLACKTCGKCYGRRSSLRRHSKVHKKEQEAANAAAGAAAGAAASAAANTASSTIAGPSGEGQN